MYFTRIFAIPIAVVDSLNDHCPVEEPSIRTMVIASTGIPHAKCKHQYDNTVGESMKHIYQYGLTISIKNDQLASSTPLPLILNVVFE